jgi:hypothetical protein
LCSSLRLRGLFGNVPAATKQQAKILELCALDLEPNYDGPVLSAQLSLTNVVEALEAFKEHRLLHAKFAAQIIVQAHALLNAEPNLQEIPVEDGTRLTIVGDLHGQLQDLFSIFTINGIPSPENKCVRIVARISMQPALLTASCSAAQILVQRRLCGPRRQRMRDPLQHPDVQGKPSCVKVALFLLLLLLADQSLAAWWSSRFCTRTRYF